MSLAFAQFAAFLIRLSGARSDDPPGAAGPPGSVTGHAGDRPCTPIPIPRSRRRPAAGSSPAPGAPSRWGALAAALLVVGGSAVALAADPAASPDPSATAQPADGGTTTPGAGTTSPGTTAPGAGHQGRGDCPAKDGTGTGTAPSSGTTPSPD